MDTLKNYVNYESTTYILFIKSTLSTNNKKVYFHRLQIRMYELIIIKNLRDP